MKHDIGAIKVLFEQIRMALAPSGFEKFLERCTDYETYRNWKSCIYREDWEDKCDITVSAGCSRVVIVPNFSNYVFKIQYDGKKKVNYCENECLVYQRAVEAGVEDFFAWTALIGFYGNAAVYAMEKVEVNEERNSNDSFYYHAEKWHEENGEEEDYPYDDYDDHDGMLEYALAHNGERMHEAIDLIHCLHINDLHCGNWGYRGETFVLVDYGGYGCNLQFDCASA